MNIKKSRKILLLAGIGLLASSSAWSNNDYSVTNNVWGQYYQNTTISGSLLGPDSNGNPLNLSNNQYFGYLYDYNTGNSSGSIPAALDHSGTWTGNPSSGFSSVDYSAYSSTTWDKTTQWLVWPIFSRLTRNTTANYVLTDTIGNPLPVHRCLDLTTQTNAPLGPGPVELA